ncbi:hypothetical protein OS493_039471 [Desmophyllum pertusum]|uniref:Apple domain-containing protein n=1 Tax=Desmophyllum pertusum TaxID=174260 RepID=A0A9X0CU59_9CNID|nr:hypothetical protein OS493_039471 [Desmophyllum pertusum]
MLGFLWLLIISVTSSASLQCSEDVRSVKGYYLTGHVVSNRSAADIGDCLVECFSDPRCKSINFRFKDLLCELNDADSYTHSADYRPSEEHAYSDYPFKECTFTELYT